MTIINFKNIGSFPGVVQIAASAGKMHELLTNPVEGNSEASAAPLTYHGGKVIDKGKGKFLNVYLGPQNFDTKDFDAFSKAMCENGYYQSPDGTDTTPCAFLDSVQIPTYPFGSVADDSQIGAWVDQQISSGKLPSQDGFTNFSLIFPVGTIVSMSGALSCNVFCGYHTRSSQGNYYQVICDSSCPGCNQGIPNEGRMMIQAHEYGEWRSDPDGTAWFNDQTGMENGDECAWQKVSFGPVGTTWVVQPLASNGQCFTGEYKPTVTPPPVPQPPPPPPVPQTTHMTVAVQPVSGSVGVQMPGFGVVLQLADGTINANDNSTMVTCTLTDGKQVFSNVQSEQAIKGTVAFKGDTFLNPHPVLHYHFTATGLPSVDSADFSITANTPPPPPPPTKTYEEGVVDGRAQMKAEVLATVGAL